jgi:phospholipid/cholesterol/gamma-HCH transport system ATP-binding protein
MAAVLEMQDVHKSFGSKHVLRGLSFSLDEGQTLVILGQSGSGKSVTLKHLVGLLAADRGRVLVQGVDLARAGREQLDQVRRQVAYLFQSGALVNWMTVRENVALSLVEGRRVPPGEVRGKVDEALQSLELAEAAEQLPEQISGGMRKRAALCRVLVQEPAVVLYDEPTGGLDPILGRTVAGLILQMQGRKEPSRREASARAEAPADRGQPGARDKPEASDDPQLREKPKDKSRRTAVVVTHDLELAFELAGAPGGLIALHDEGRLTELGPLDAFRKSKHPVIRAFLDGGRAGEAPRSRPR